MSETPRYDELPRVEQLDLPIAWDVLPQAWGTLSFQGPDQVRRAAHAVRTGEVITLGLPLDAFDPPLFGRPALRNAVTETARNTFEDSITDLNPQASSQWDGLPHIRAREHGFFSGITDVSEAREALGVHHWAAKGIVGRGVLVDVVRAFQRRNEPWDALSGQTVEPDDLAEALAADGVELEAGDVLLVRTGWLAQTRARNEPATGDRFSGLASHDGMVRMLWDARVAAVGSDNPAVESAPGDVKNGSLHRKLIPALGYALAELLDLDALAERCVATGSTTFLFVAAPTPLRGAVSSPANALAIL